MTDNQRRVIARLAAAGVVATIGIFATGICECGTYGCDYAPQTTSRVLVNGQQISWGVFSRLAVADDDIFRRNCHAFNGAMFVDMGDGTQVRVSNRPSWTQTQALSGADMFHV